MRKKFSIPILSTLIAGLILSPAEIASAAISDRGSIWWSVPELLEYYQEVEAERIATCGEDFDCNMNFEFDYYEKSEKYRALHNILEGQIWVTAINPTDETIRVVFYDEDMMLKRMGIEEHLELEHLYFGWFEEWNGQIYSYDHDSFTNGTTPGSHPLYDSTVEDLSLITPWEEVELSVAGGNLIDNPTGKIDYAAFAKDNKFNAQGHFDYSSCLSAPDYQEGAECTMYVSGDQGFSYFPPRESIVIVDEPVDVEPEPAAEPEPVTEPEPTTEPEPVTEPEPATEPEPGIEPEAPTDADQPAPADDPADIDSSTPAGNDDATTDASTDNITANTPESTAGPSSPAALAPETGTLTTEGESAIEFPWWLGTIVALNVVTLTWLFLPIRIKTPKNTVKSHRTNKLTSGTARKSYFSSKKCRKTLDKIPHLR